MDEKKVLVTGGSGIVGSELIRQLLQKEQQVLAIQHSTPFTFSHPLLEQVEGDILDVEGLAAIMQKVCRVYHCAALVSYNPGDKQKLFKINVEGTANVVNACIEAGVEKLVHVSSVAALGRIRNEAMVSEQMNWTEETSNSFYGKSKYTGELEVWRGIGEGLAAVIVNPSLVLGPGDWNSSSTAIFKNVYQEFPWYTDGVSGFVDVRDVARAMILLMNSDITSERFIVNGKNLPYREVFSTIATCFGKKPPYKKVTPFLAEVVWRLEALKTFFTGKGGLLTRETARTAQAKIYFDNSKLLQALPEFQFTPITEAISFACQELTQKYRLAQPRH